MVEPSACRFAADTDLQALNTRSIQCIDSVPLIRNFSTKVLEIALGRLDHPQDIVVVSLLLFDHLCSSSVSDPVISALLAALDTTAKFGFPSSISILVLSPIHYLCFLPSAMLGFIMLKMHRLTNLGTQQVSEIGIANSNTFAL